MLMCFFTVKNKTKQCNICYFNTKFCTCKIKKQPAVNDFKLLALVCDNVMAVLAYKTGL